MNSLDKIKELLPLVRKPGRYIGNETNAFHKPWDQVRLKTVLIFPDLYEIGMSHLGLHILYDILNRNEWTLADRAYRPDLDMEELLRLHEIPLYGLESGRPLSEFDIVGITLPYELCYSNIPAILDLSDIPLMASDRHGEHHPVVIGGGSCACNPEPVAELFDAIVFGDGEEIILEVAEAVEKWKREGSAKTTLLKNLASIPGIYVPSLYRPLYDEKGRFKGVETSLSGGGIVKRRIIRDLEKAPFPEKPLVPFINIVHDRLGVEIARGCTRGCRFCQASSIYRPVRERSPETLLKIIDKALKNSGWDELSLLSLSTGDYACLHQVIKSLMERYLPDNISVSLPSLRVGTLTGEIMEEIKKVRKTGFTLAPEAGSERMRQVINKGITEKDLLDTAQNAYLNGWSNMKLYFMAGLPFETMEDVAAIPELAASVLKQGKTAKGRKEVTVSLGTFVPKPHTPFQWEAQISMEEAWKRIELVKDRVSSKKIRVKWHDPRQSFLEGVFSRGDRRLLPVIIEAWKVGAALDAWSDHLRPELYLEAAEKHGLDLEGFLGPRSKDAPLPWDHLDTGIRKEFLMEELGKAKDMALTGDCRRGRCNRCGVCDLKELKPITCKPDKAGTGSTVAVQDGSKAKDSAQDKEKYFFYNFLYSKTDEARLMSHLETISAFHRAARRAGLPVAFSKGFHPMMRFSFANPLPLGMESTGEQGALVMSEWLRPEKITRELNVELPHGISIVSISSSNRKPSFRQGKEKTFLAFMRSKNFDKAVKEIDAFNQDRHIQVTKKTKKKEVIIDLSDAVKSLELFDRETLPENLKENRIIMAWMDSAGIKEKESLIVCSLNTAKSLSLRPDDLLRAVLNGINDEEITCSRILVHSSEH